MSSLMLSGVLALDDGVFFPYVPKILGVLLLASDVVLILVVSDTFGVVTGVL